MVDSIKQTEINSMSQLVCLWFISEETILPLCKALNRRNRQEFALNTGKHKTLLNAVAFARHMEVIPDMDCFVNVFCFVVEVVM